MSPSPITQDRQRQAGLSVLQAATVLSQREIKFLKSLREDLPNCISNVVLLCFLLLFGFCFSVIWVWLVLKEDLTVWLQLAWYLQM